MTAADGSVLGQGNAGEARDPGAGRWAHLSLAVALAALLVAHRGLLGLAPGKTATGTSDLDRMLYQPSMMEPVLALGVFGLLILHRRARILEALRAGRGAASGWLVLALGVALLLWSRQIDADRLLVPSLMLQLLGAALVVGGPPLAGALGLPLAALATSVPLPPQVLQAVLLPLQLWTVALASALLDLLGRDHAVLGDLVLYGSDRFQVIEGCSGFKTIVSLVLAAIVYAEFVASRPLAKAALIALAIPIGLFVNGMRVVILIVERIPPEAPAHAAWGLGAIVLGVVLLAVTETSSTLLARRIRPVGTQSGNGAPPHHPASTSPLASVTGRAAAGRGHRSVSGLLAVSLVAAAIAAEGVPRASWPSPATGLNIESLPETIDGRTAVPLDVDDTWLGDVRFGHRIYRSYERPAPRDAARAPSGAIRVFIGLEDTSSAERTGLSPKTVLPSSGWKSIKRLPPFEPEREHDGSRRWSRRVIDYPERVVCVLHTRMGFAPWGLEALARWLGTDRAGVFGARRSPLVIRLERDLHAGDEAAAWMSLRQFAAHVEAWAAAARGEPERARNVLANGP